MYKSVWSYFSYSSLCEVITSICLFISGGAQNIFSECHDFWCYRYNNSMCTVSPDYHLLKYHIDSIQLLTMLIILLRFCDQHRTYLVVFGISILEVACRLRLRLILYGRRCSQLWISCSMSLLIVLSLHSGMIIWYYTGLQHVVTKIIAKFFAL